MTDRLDRQACDEAANAWCRANGAVACVVCGAVGVGAEYAVCCWEGERLPQGPEDASEADVEGLHELLSHDALVEAGMASPVELALTAERAAIDVRYAMGQLERAGRYGDAVRVQDCVNRALDGLGRAVEALAPPAEHDRWQTVPACLPRCHGCGEAVLLKDAVITPNGFYCGRDCLRACEAAPKGWDLAPTSVPAEELRPCALPMGWGELSGIAMTVVGLVGMLLAVVVGWHLQ